MTMRSLLGLLCVLAMCVPAVAVDTDGDGLLDLMDVRGFDAGATGEVAFWRRGIQDLDGANLLTNATSLELWGSQITSIEPGDFDGLSNLQTLGLFGNQIGSIERGDFEGLTNLQSLYLDDSQITTIEPGDFEGLANLQLLYLADNQITSIENYAFNGLSNLTTLVLYDTELVHLNLTGATLKNLRGCGALPTSPIWLIGICADSEEIASLTLDGAVLSHGSFDAIVGETTLITGVSLVGLTFSDTFPENLNSLLTIETLNNVTVDQSLFDQYADEFNAFAAMEGNTLTVVPGLCDVNRNTVCDITDIDQMLQNVLDGGRFTAEDLQLLIRRPMPHGFNTYYGDANLDGVIDSEDLVTVLAAGEYEDDTVGNSTWSTGDWSADGEFTTEDLVTALADGGYEAGPRPAAVPEPAGWVLAALSATALLWRSRRPLPLLVVPLVLACSADIQADIYRWDNGELILGTEGIEPGPGVQVAERDLRFADLREIDLTEAGFGGSILSDADLSGATLKRAGFAGATLTGANLEGVDLSGGSFSVRCRWFIIPFYCDAADLSNARLSSANLSYAVLGGTNLAGADLSGAIVRGADLSQSNLNSEQLYSTSSYQAKDLRDLQLLGGDFDEWDLSQQDLTGSSLYGGFKGALFDQAVLRSAWVRGDFSNASFANSSLSGANLRGSQFAESDFRGAILINTEIQDALLTNADFSGALVHGAQFSRFGRGPDTGLSRDQLYSTGSYNLGALGGIGLGEYDLTEWDLRQIDLTGADLRRSSLGDLSGANLTGALLQSTDLTDAVLVGANLAGARLPIADVTNADLKGVNLGSADLSVTLTFSGAVFDGSTTYNQWTAFPTRFDPVTNGLTLIMSPPGDIDGNPGLSIADIDMISDRLNTANRRHWLPDEAFDLDHNGIVNRRDYTAWVHEVVGTWLGDADLDGEFTSGDLIAVLSKGEYEIARRRGDGLTILNPVSWSEGDWNGDGEFTSADLIVALADGGYEVGRRPVAVPEPTSPLLLMMGVLVSAMSARGNSRHKKTPNSCAAH